MSIEIPFAGQEFVIPQVGDTGWGQNLTSYFQALAQFAFQNPADYSNATLALRQYIQTITTNAPTYFTFIPSGTNTNAAVQFYSDSLLTNGSSLFVGTNGSTYNYITSGNIGTGTILPIEIQVGTNTNMTFNTDGTVDGSHLVNIPTSGLAHNSITIGSTSIALGNTSTTLAGLTSVTSSGFTGSLTGNASTATLASTVTTTVSTSNTNYDLALVNGTSIVYGTATFNPSTGALSASSFTGGGSGLTGTASSLTSGGVITTSTTGNVNYSVALVNSNAIDYSTGHTYNPSTGVLVAPTFSGAGTNLTGTAASLTAGNATLAATATNLAGGLAGYVPYQTAAGTTSYAVPNTNGYVLTLNSSLIPVWAPSTGGGGGGISTVNGTANQIASSTSAGVVTLSLPSSIVASALTLNSTLTAGTSFSIFGASTSSAFTMAANPAGSYTSGGAISLFGSASGAPGEVTIGAPGGLNVTGSMAVSGFVCAGAGSVGMLAGDLSASRTSDTGVVYLGTDGNHYLYYNSNYSLPSGALVVGGNITFDSIQLSSPTTYGSFAASGSNNGYAGIQFTGTTNNRTFMIQAASSTPITGVYAVNSAAWDWYFTGNTLTQGVVPAANIGAGTAGISISGTSAGVTVTATASNVAYSVAFATSTTTLGYDNGGSFTYNPSTNQLSVPGPIVGTSLDATSDENLKDNITKIDDAEQIVSALNGVRFNWKKTGGASAGLIAQDVEKVIPELVSISEDGVKSLNYNGIIGVLVEQVKALTARISILENK